MNFPQSDIYITAGNDKPNQVDLGDLAPEDCYSIRRTGSNDEYQAQDLPFARYPSKPGVVYRAGTEVGGRRCPRCPDFIAVTSRVVRLPRSEKRRWWVHERCYSRLGLRLITGWISAVPIAIAGNGVRG